MSAAVVDTVVRVAVSLVPVAALVVVLAFSRPSLRQRMAALLAGIAALVGIVLVDAVAVAVGWWSFAPSPGSVLGQPADLVLAWAVLWGALPTLVDRWSVPATVAGLAMLDLVVMPFVPGVTLGSSWVVGEAVALAFVAVPSVLLGRLVTQRRHLGARVVLQVATATALLVGVVPLVALGVDAGARLPGPDLVTWLGVQLGAAGALVAVAGVHELWLRGQGSPWPWDPPRRVVTSGPYRYVSNPMQLGAVVLLIGEAVVLRSVLVLGLAVTGAVFAVTSARLHESTTAGRRLGDAWTRHHRAVRPWRPSWRPTTAPDEPAVLWIARTCGGCSELGDWLERRRPAGLEVRAAELHPDGPPRRVTYTTADGFTASGVVAFAHALEHLDLGWALTGMTLRLPLVAALAGTIGDLTGFAPQDVPGLTPDQLRTATREHPTCPMPTTPATG